LNDAVTGGAATEADAYCEDMETHDGPSSVLSDHPTPTAFGAAGLTTYACG
jgi:hypothetical protein